MNKLFAYVGAGLLVIGGTPLFAQVNSISSANMVRELSMPQRDLRRLMDEAKKQDLAEEERELRKQAREASEKELKATKTQSFSENIRFYLAGINFNNSKVLASEELETIVRPYLNKDITGKELTSLLEEINLLYRQKGYVVCQAVLQPQRISKNVLKITLIEGKTGEVKVSSADPGENFKTRPGYILRSFDLLPGEVANYREMLDDLVRFNMTNDIQLSVDLRAGKEVETTDYEIFVHEPAPRLVNVFADSYGSKSSGRYRAGFGFTERSLLGWRDRFQLVGLVSQGTRSVLASYSIPLNSFGTRLTPSFSYGKVKVVDGPSEDFQIKGHSKSLSLRLDHPLHTTSTSKLTGFIQFSRQTSETNMFEVLTVSDTSVKNLSAGLEELWLTEELTLYANGQYIESWTKDYTFDNSSRYRRLVGNFSLDWVLKQKYGFSVQFGGQDYLGGGNLASGEYFYLGSSSGVRGYENDVASAYSGGWLNLEAKYFFDKRNSNVFAFFDVGRLAGESSYKVKTLSSLGIGAQWRPFNWLTASASVAFPLKRQIGSEHANKARFDFVLNAVW